MASESRSKSSSTRTSSLSHKAKACYADASALVPRPYRTLWPAEPLLADNRDELPIQAADLSAWGVRRASDTKPHQYRWLASTLVSRPSWEEPPPS